MGVTYGVPVDEIVEGIRNGVRKVNIDTDLRMASTGAIRKHLSEDRKNFDPRKFYKEATKAMQAICAARYEAFGSAGMAARITKVHSLETMQKRCAQGELAARVA
jgi:fructose-bisphosphate aldolase, class II